MTRMKNHNKYKLKYKICIEEQISYVFDIVSHLVGVGTAPTAGQYGKVK